MARAAIVEAAEQAVRENEKARNPFQQNDLSAKFPYVVYDKLLPRAPCDRIPTKAACNKMREMQGRIESDHIRSAVDAFQNNMLKIGSVIQRPSYTGMARMAEYHLGKGSDPYLAFMVLLGSAAAADEIFQEISQTLDIPEPRNVAYLFTSRRLTGHTPTQSDSNEITPPS